MPALLIHKDLTPEVLFVLNDPWTAPGVIDHGGLLGLADDDHVQYLLINGTRDMTGSLLPNAAGTLDLGNATDGWRTMYLDNDGGNVITLPPAGAAGVSYTFDLGGGNPLSTSGQRNTFTMQFQNQQVNFTGGNDYVLDMGLTSLFDQNTWKLQSNVGGAIGIIEIGVNFVGIFSGLPGANSIAFVADSSASFALPFGFINQALGGLFFDVTPTFLTTPERRITLDPSLPNNVGSNQFVNAGTTSNSAIIIGNHMSWRQVTKTGGTSTRWCNLQVNAMTSNIVGGTVQETATVYIPGAANFGTVGNWSLWVDAGNVRFDGILFMNQNSILSAIGWGAPAAGIIYYDGTNFIVDPDFTGTGRVLIGALADDGLACAGLEFNAELQANHTLVTGTTHTAALEHIILVDDDTAGSTVTVTLPAAAGQNRLYHIKKLGTTANVVVDANASETIDGSLTITLVQQYESKLLYSDGANWHII